MPRNGRDLLYSMETDPLLANVQSGTPRSGKHGKKDEHSLSPRQAVKAYPMAIFWTLAVSMTVIMEGVCNSITPSANGHTVVEFLGESC